MTDKELEAIRGLKIKRARREDRLAAVRELSKLRLPVDEPQEMARESVPSPGSLMLKALE